MYKKDPRIHDIIAVSIYTRPPLEMLHVPATQTRHRAFYGLEALAEELPARDLRAAEAELGRDREEGRGEDASRVREADRADLELALLLRAFRARAGRVVLLLVDAVEHVYARGKDRGERTWVSNELSPWEAWETEGTWNA